MVGRARGDGALGSLDGMTNEMTRVAQAGPADLIATVWFTLGYKPRDSLVLVALKRPRNLVGVMLRADLPGRSGAAAGAPPGTAGAAGAARAGGAAGPAAGELLTAMVRDLLDTVVQSGARTVMAMIAVAEVLDRPPRELIRVLRREAHRSGLTLLDVLGVTPTAFGSLMCRDQRCCPPCGRPIEEVLCSRSAAAHVVNGQTLAEDEAGLLTEVAPARGPAGDRAHEPAGDPVRDPVRVPAGDSARNPVLDAVPRPGPGGPRATGIDGGRRADWWRQWVAHCARTQLPTGPDLGRPGPGPGPTGPAVGPGPTGPAVGPGLAGPAVGPGLAGPAVGPGLALSGPGVVDLSLAGLSGALHDPALRDAVLMYTLGATDAQARVLLEQHRGTDSRPIPTEPDYAGLLRRAPQQARLQAGRSVLTGAVRVAAAGERGPGLAVLALLAWFEGQGGRARLLAQQARADVRADVRGDLRAGAGAVSLLGLVEDLLTHRVPPPWLLTEQQQRTGREGTGRAGPG